MSKCGPPLWYSKDIKKENTFAALGRSQRNSERKAEKEIADLGAKIAKSDSAIAKADAQAVDAQKAVDAETRARDQAAPAKGKAAVAAKRKPSKAETALTAAQKKAERERAAREKLVSQKAKAEARKANSAAVADEYEQESARWKAMREAVGEKDPCCLLGEAKKRGPALDEEKARLEKERAAAAKRAEGYDARLAKGQKLTAKERDAHKEAKEAVNKIDKRLGEIPAERTAAAAELKEAEERIETYRTHLQAIVDGRKYPRCAEAKQYVPKAASPPELNKPEKDCKTNCACSKDCLRKFLESRGAGRAAGNDAELERKAAAFEKAAAQAGITDCKAKAAFMAQMAHESNNFTMLTEQTAPNCLDDTEEDRDLWYEAFYGNHTGLGNFCPGDGKNFRGRGYKQLTGRENYANYSRDAGRDYVSAPGDLATNDEAAWDSAAWFWKTKNLGAHAAGLPDGRIPEPASDKEIEATDPNQDAFNKMTQKINGGQLGARQRRAAYNDALDACFDPPAKPRPATAKAAAEKKAAEEKAAKAKAEAAKAATPQTSAGEKSGTASPTPAGKAGTP